MSDRPKLAIAERAQQLALSGDFGGFNALIQILTEEYGAPEVERLRRDHEARRTIADRCSEAWARKHR